MFLGLEREWSQRSAGIRTFALVSLLAAVFTVTERDTPLVLGGVLVIVQGILLAAQGLRAEEPTLSLTTSVSLLVAYGVGAIDETTAMLAILLATAASIVLRAAVIVPGPDRSFAGRVAIRSTVVLGGASALTVVMLA